MLKVLRLANQRRSRMVLQVRSFAKKSCTPNASQLWPLSWRRRKPFSCRLWTARCITGKYRRCSACYMGDRSSPASLSTPSTKTGTAQSPPSSAVHHTTWPIPTRRKSWKSSSNPTRYSIKSTRTSAWHGGAMNEKTTWSLSSNSDMNAKLTFSRPRSSMIMINMSRLKVLIRHLPTIWVVGYLMRKRLAGLLELSQMLADLRFQPV